MSDTSNPALSQPEAFGKRLRQLAVGTLFALVLLIPKILQVRRNPRGNNQAFRKQVMITAKFAGQLKGDDRSHTVTEEGKWLI